MDGDAAGVEPGECPGGHRTLFPLLDVQSGVWWGPHGELSYEAFGPRLVVRYPSGQIRSFLLGDWHATCWLPNDTIFAVNLSKDTLGMLSPAEYERRYHEGAAPAG